MKHQVHEKVLGNSHIWRDEKNKTSEGSRKKVITRNKQAN